MIYPRYASYLHDFFKNVYVDDNCESLSNEYSTSVFSQLGHVCFAEHNILEALTGLNLKKGIGPDKVSPLLLHNCANSLSVPLTFIFNKSLSVGIFPQKWKISYISPIHKSGSRRSVENYRGVAILPTIGKLFELLVTQVMTRHFRHFISPAQHGFMSGRSTVTNLLEFSNCAISVLESGEQLDVVYTDIRKAFDRLNHSILLKKLNSIGVYASLLSWIRSYLQNRSQYARIFGWESHTFTVHSGVP